MDGLDVMWSTNDGATMTVSKVETQRTASVTSIESTIKAPGSTPAVTGSGRILRRQGERVSATHIDHDQVHAYEGVMAELLVAARIRRPKKLSRMAEIEMLRAQQSHTPDGLRATAEVLRLACIRLGMPACRYRDTDWRVRGLAE